MNNRQNTVGGGRRRHLHFEDIISLENILEAWEEFIKGKKRKRMFQRLRGLKTPETLSSYLGLIKHGNTRKLKKIMLQ